MLPTNLTNFGLVVQDNKEALTVLDYEYMAGLSTLYKCQINFISSDPGLDYWSFVDKSCSLKVTIQGAKSVQNIDGIITEFVQMGKLGKGYCYQIIVEPRMAQLQHQKRTEIFLNQTLPEIIVWYFKNSNIPHYRLDLTQNYVPRAFICQFQETDYNFICRWMEHEGIYYYFEHGDDYETLVLTDRYSTHKDHGHFSELRYNTENVKSIAKSEYIVEEFSTRITKVAKSLQLTSYNYNEDSKDISAMAEVSKNGVGVIDIYDENVLSDTDAKRIAEIRAQEINCQELLYHGKTLTPGVIPGCRFKLTNHFNPKNNQVYLVLSLKQEGSQRQLALSYFGDVQKMIAEEEEIVFINEFKAIPGSAQFRPPRLTPIKRIEGIIPAILDADSESNKYAQLDTQGRYKIRLMHSDKENGKASDWVRKMESYIGDNYGTHAPLHKNTEVCLAFEFGNPDRPIIIGAVHSSSMRNVVNDTNQKTTVNKSAGGNMMIMGDQAGQEFLHLHSPSGGAHLMYGNVAAASLNSNLMGSNEGDPMPWPDEPWNRSGYPRPPEDLLSKYEEVSGPSASNQDGNSYSYLDGDVYGVTNGNKNYATYGNSCDIRIGNTDTTTHGNAYSKFMGGTESFKLSNDLSVTAGASESFFLGALKTDISACAAIVSITAGLVRYSYDGVLAKHSITEGHEYRKTFSTDNVVLTNYTTTAAIGISNTATAGNIINTAGGVIKMGSSDFQVASAAAVDIKAPVIELEAMTSLKLTCGASSITMTPDAIQIAVGPSRISLAPTGVGISCATGGVTISGTSIQGSAASIDWMPI